MQNKSYMQENTHQCIILGLLYFLFIYFDISFMFNYSCVFIPFTYSVIYSYFLTFSFFRWCKKTTSVKQNKTHTHTAKHTWLPYKKNTHSTHSSGPSSLVSLFSLFSYPSVSVEKKENTPLGHGLTYWSIMCSWQRDNLMGSRRLKSMSICASSSVLAVLLVEVLMVCGLEPSPLAPASRELRFMALGRPRGRHVLSDRPCRFEGRFGRRHFCRFVPVIVVHVLSLCVDVRQLASSLSVHFSILCVALFVVLRHLSFWCHSICAICRFCVTCFAPFVVLVSLVLCHFAVLVLASVVVMRHLSLWFWRWFRFSRQLSSL